MSIGKIARRLVEGPFEARQEKATRGRVSYGKGDFIDSFNTPKTSAENVWDLFVSEASLRNFKPEPDDEIAYLFGIVDEDLEDLVEEALKRCGRVLPEQGVLREMDPIETIGDLGEFVSQCPQIEGGDDSSSNGQ